MALEMGNWDYKHTYNLTYTLLIGGVILHL